MIAQLSQNSHKYINNAVTIIKDNLKNKCNLLVVVTFIPQ